MMISDKSFYPTPKPLIEKMLNKIQREEIWSATVLEPSAGKGDIIEYASEGSERMWSGRRAIHLKNFSAIEINEDLQATLRGKNIKVIDTDFLSFSGPDKFDIIIANPPFETGDQHLLKAIDIMYRGEIVFLLNAETLKNPYTNTRKELTRKLSELGANIEYIQNAFIDAERPTGVEVALVYIKIERQVEQDLFAGVDDKASEVKPELETDYEVSTRKPIQDMVAEYNQIIKIGTETIIGYYKNYRKIGRYIGLNREADKYHGNGDMTDKMQSDLNDMIVAVRKNFWRKTLDIKEVRDRLTSAKQKEFEYQVEKRCDMNFTENNIRKFILNLIGSYEQTLIEAVMDIFDMFTVRHSYSGGLYDENVHYFNGWKTNKAFKVGKKVIFPLYGGYGRGPFIDEYSGKWKLAYEVPGKLGDIDKVMSYFDGMNNYYSMSEAITHAFARGESRKIESTYFTITCYKKGTIHLEFNSEDILRRFNVAACRGKNWLMHEYGRKPYDEMPEDEKQVIDSFEGMEAYTQNLNRPLFAGKDLLKLAA